jgi:hypothetical protein
MSVDTNSPAFRACAEEMAASLGISLEALTDAIDRNMADFGLGYRTDRPVRGRNNAAMRRSGRELVAHAHARAAARLGIPRLSRKLKKKLWRDDPEYFC